MTSCLTSPSPAPGSGGPSRLFILRPVATSLLMLTILLAGILGYRQLPIAALPQVDYPTIQVTTLYPGAGADLSASAITAPLEYQFSQMPGLAHMTSQSAVGASVITLQFQLTLALDVAEQEVQAAINNASNLLPRDLPYPPTYNKVNPADPPIMTLAITSDSLPMTQVENLVETRVVQKIAQVNGVGLVSIAGGQRPAVRVNFNANALAAYGLDSETIRNAISSANINSPKGSIDGPTRAITLSANDQMMSLDDYRQLIIAYHNGAPVRLKDVASISQNAENQWLAAWANRQPAIILNIQRQPGANIIATADTIKSRLPQIMQSLPKSVKVQVLTDRTTNIRASIHDVRNELFFAIGLVILVIYLFLRNATATFIPSIVVPLSLIGTFAVIYFLGFSINNLTLMALTIATGFVVDDAIVVIENIARYIEKGESSLTAALRGAGEIGFTIISLTFSLIAVLIPLLFMGDIVGRLFREFAVTLALAILISGFISLTLTPMMCARFLSHQQLAKQSRFSLACEQIIDRLIAYYGQWLTKVLAYPLTTLTVALATLVLTVLLYIFIPKGFFPAQDNSLLQATLVTSQSSSFQQMQQRQQQLIAKLLTNPNILNIAAFVGVDGNNNSLNSSRLQITLKPIDQRSQTSEQIIQQLQQQAAQLADSQLYLQSVQDLTIDTQTHPLPYAFTLQVSQQAQLAQWVPQLMQQLRQLPELSQVDNNWQNQGPTAYVNVNRNTASQLGLTMADIDTALYNAFGQRLISTIYSQSSQYRVVLTSQNTDSDDLASLQQLQLKNDQGKMIPLTSVATLEETLTPLSYQRWDQFPAVTFSFNVTPGYALSDAVQAISQAEQQLQLPADIITHFQGSTQAFQKATANSVWLIIAAIVAMYIVLGILYESFIHPVTILSTLPTAAVGALLALWLTGRSFDMIAVIGIILLIGIVKKNAIMMIDFALSAEREQGLPAHQAIYQACLLRFRPILMTTLAALFGALPLMLSHGVGAELRQPLGVCMVSGLLMSQLLTLFTTPVIYLLFDKLARRLRPQGKKASH